MPVRKILPILFVLVAFVFTACKEAGESEAMQLRSSAPATLEDFNAEDASEETGAANALASDAAAADADEISEIRSDTIAPVIEEPVLYENPFHDPADAPLSSFGTDVDGAAYSNLRAHLRSDRPLHPAAIRIEELVNYFDYDYPQPRGEHPFSVATEIGDCPWNRDNRLLRIALQARDVDLDNAPPANLVFLVDVSGSMSNDDKLPLLKESLLAYVDRMRPNDRVALVTYAGNAGVALNSTSGSDRDEIRDAIEDLESGGSTAGASGIVKAYEIALRNFDPDGNNRVILATDGDFNVGISSRDDLIAMIEKKRDDGIYLSVLRFGLDSYGDAAMEGLADNGNGNYYFIDSEREGERVMVEKLTTTILTIATDTKIQVEFNPRKVAAYRLIGYENRALTTEEFDDDRKDAGDLGAGSSVTAFYEIVPVGRAVPAVAGERDNATPQSERFTFGPDEIAGIRLRYKKPGQSKSRLFTTTAREPESRQAPSSSFLFASAVVEWGLMLRGSAYAPDASLTDLRARAERAIRGSDDRLKREFVDLLDDSEDRIEEIRETREGETLR